ncbi:MAG: 6-pyruvoyl tetrahydrobiopterin synthase [Fluviicola sp. XM-24bin1]|nr:MAG: 6-pyruvoyl tetrahydrobiopterin synthase [Fluviicola sp. XM-24bin1]
MAGETIRICRRETFNAAHRLYRKEWSDEKNYEVFGKCSHPNYHGHNYVIEVWLEGPIDPVTGYLMDLKELKTIIQREVCDRFDHRNFNLDCEEFKDRIPTAENIAVVCWQLIQPQLPDNLRLEVHIQETEKNKVSYSGG